MNPIINTTRKGYNNNKCMYPVYSILIYTAAQAACTTLNVSKMAVLCAFGK